MNAAFFTSLFLSEKCGGSDCDASLADFARRIRDRLMWTILEWSLGDPNRIYKKIELSQLNAYILFVVASEGSIAIGEVAKKLRQEKSVITKSLARLIDRGLVEKKRDPNDGRRIILTTTDEGRRVQRELDALSIEGYSKWLRHIPESEREEIVDVIERLDDAMTKRRSERAGESVQNGR